MVKYGEGFFTSLGFDPLPKTFWERSHVHEAAGPRGRLPRERLGRRLRWTTCASRCASTSRPRTSRPSTTSSATTSTSGPTTRSRPSSATAPTTASTRRSATRSRCRSRRSTWSSSACSTRRRTRRRTSACFSRKALEKVAFLPFGLLIDQWRWKVFSGEITPAQYNKAWWDLRLKYQGVAPAGRAHRGGLRSGREVPRRRRTSRTRATSWRDILQFQFHRALAQDGRLHDAAQPLLDLREQGRGRAAGEDARDGAAPAVAGRARGADRPAGDGRDARSSTTSRRCRSGSTSRTRASRWGGRGPSAALRLRPS